MKTCSFASPRNASPQNHEGSSVWGRGALAWAVFGTGTDTEAEAGRAVRMHASARMWGSIDAATAITPPRERGAV